MVSFPRENDVKADFLLFISVARRAGKSKRGYRVKEGQYDKILQEINSVKISCHGNILKVIIETCMLTDEEKIKLCEVVSNSAADYIKTSTGFGGGT